MHDRTAPSFHHIDGALAIRPNMKELISKDSQEIHVENDCGPTSRESLAGPRLRLNRRSVRVDMELENGWAITRNLKRSKVIFQTFRALKKSTKSCGCLMPKNSRRSPTVHAGGHSLNFTSLEASPSLYKKTLPLPSLAVTATPVDHHLLKAGRPTREHVLAFSSQRSCPCRICPTGWR